MAGNQTLDPLMNEPVLQPLSILAMARISFFVSGALLSVHCGGKVLVLGQLGLGYGPLCMAISLIAQASGGYLQSSIHFIYLCL